MVGQTLNGLLLRSVICTVVNHHTSQKKRVESGIAFIVGQWGMIYFMLNNHAALTASDVVLWSGVEFAIAGYIVNQIQREKSTTPKDFLDDQE